MSDCWHKKAKLLFLSDEGPMLETLDYTIRIGSIPTFLYFDLYTVYMYMDIIYISAARRSLLVYKKMKK